jgi:hypothetical protein
VEIPTEELIEVPKIEDGDPHRGDIEAKNSMV